MEVILLLSCALTTLSTANVGGAATDTPLHVISLDDLPQSDQSYLAYLEHEDIRQERSDDLLGLIKEKISQGIKSKIGKIASVNSHLSSGGNKGHNHYDEHHHEEDEKMFDFWNLKKLILHTLLQPVKPIKRGLIAIKGQLIKRGGYWVSAKGKLLSAKGEAITNIGNHIVSSANLGLRPSHHSGPSGHSGPEIIYGGPPSRGYGAPSGRGIELHIPPYGHLSHGYPEHHPSGFDGFKDHLAKGAQHGIFIVKKVPNGLKDKYNGNHGAHSPPEMHKPDSKPEEHPDKRFKFLPDMKSILSASSLFKHQEETSDSHHKPPHHHYESSSTHHDIPPQHYEPKPVDHEPPHHQFESFQHKSALNAHQPISNYYEPLLDHYKPQPLNYKPKPSHLEHQPAHFSSSGALSNAGHSNDTSYGAPLMANDNRSAEYLKDFQTAYTKLKHEPYDDSLKTDLPLPGSNSTPQGHNSLYASKSSMSYPQRHSTGESSLIPDLSNFSAYPIDLSSSNYHRRQISSRKAKASPMHAMH